MDQSSINKEQKHKIRISQQGMNTLLAITVYIYILLCCYLGGKFAVHNRGLIATDMSRFLFAWILSLIQISIVFVICIGRKEKLSTIGLHRKNIGKSLLLGLVVSIIFVIITGYMKAWKISNLVNHRSLLLMYVIYYLVFIAFTEEVLFRGYMGTRLLESHKWVSRILTGLMFSTMHIPFQMTVKQMSLSEYFIENWWHLCVMFMFYHLLFQWMYKKYDNLAAPVLLHFVMNFTGWLAMG